MFDKTTSFFHKNSSSNSINDLNNIIQDETDDDKSIENFNYHQSNHCYPSGSTIRREGFGF
jgi:hypothetical protein